MSEVQTYGHFVGGKDVFEGKVLDRRDPADGRVVSARFHNGTPDVVERALQTAQAAFPAWARLTERERAEPLLIAAQMLRGDRGKELADAISRDTGKPRRFAGGETEKTRRILQQIGALALTKPRGTLIDSETRGNMLQFSRKKPVGPVLALGPFNFPGAVPSWKIAPALAAGCPVIFKPSPHAPISGAVVTRLFYDALEGVGTLRNGLLSRVQGGPETVRQLLLDERVRGVTFTGATGIGESIYRQVVGERRVPLNGKHFVGELGGLAAVIVDESADIDKAVEAVVDGAFLGEGQRCTATKRLILLKEIAARFIEKLLAKVATLKVGPASDPSVDIGPLITPQALEAVLFAVRTSLANGMTRLSGGEKLTTPDLEHGNFMAPTILEGNPDTPGHLPFHQEVFGPVLVLAVVETFEEALKIHNNNGAQLDHAGALFSRDMRNIGAYLESAEVGMGHVNTGTKGVDPGLPFGGSGQKRTSLGEREMGPGAMEPFLIEQSWEVDLGGGVSSAPGATK